MDEIRWSVFGYIVSHVENPLESSVDTIVDAFLNWARTPLQVALVLYVALTGLLVMRGLTSEAAGDIINRVLKMSLVVWLITGAGIYGHYVNDFFFRILPDDISGALSGTAQPVSGNSFDAIWLKAWNAGLQVLKSLSWSDFGEKLVVVIFWLAAIVSTVFTFAIWLVSRVVLALYIALGPLLVGLVLFPATVAIFQRWIGSLIACVILQITTLVLLQLVLDVEVQIVGQIAAISSADVIARLQVLLAGVIFFAVAAFLAVQLPAIANTLAGGLHFHTGAIARALTTVTTRTATIAVQAPAAAARMGWGAGRALAQRIRPSPGGSLSSSSSS